MPGMIGQLETIVLDCPDPARLAEFYAAVLGLPVGWDDADWVTLGKTEPLLAFQKALDHQPPKWPDPDRPQQFHLDIRVEDIEAAEQSVLALGAIRLADGDGDFRVYADPAGHPFCLIYGT
jgi:catechol 2,3-dioxygenase-like lactoylglutathione lyase family enzyme